MIIQIDNLISFYDYFEENIKSDISPITGMIGEEVVSRILEHRFINQENSTCEILPEHPKQVRDLGRKTLDRWLKVTNGNITTFYQAEIKNWTSYSYGIPHTLNPDSSIQEINTFAQDIFAKEWDANTNAFRQDRVNKVLLAMQDPPNYHGEAIRPIACYWFPICQPENVNEIKYLTTLQCGYETFAEVDIFSVSLYLRELLNQDIHEIELDMNIYETRINHIQNFFIQ